MKIAGMPIFLSNIISRQDNARLREHVLTNDPLVKQLLIEGMTAYANTVIAQRIQELKEASAVRKANESEANPPQRRTPGM